MVIGQIAFNRTDKYSFEYVIGDIKSGEKTLQIGLAANPFWEVPMKFWDIT